MERVEFPALGDAERMVEAVERGDEVVLTRDGRIVAELKSVDLSRTDVARTGKIDLDAIGRLHARLPDELRGQGATIVAELRESYRY